MKTILSLILSTGMIGTVGCSKSESAAGEVSDMTMQQSMSSEGSHDTSQEAHTMVKLPTIQCGTCEDAIETKLVKTAGILSVDVDLDSKMGHINFDENKINLKDIELAIARLGYQANKTPADPLAYENLPNCCKVPED